MSKIPVGTRIFRVEVPAGILLLVEVDKMVPAGTFHPVEAG